MKTMLMRKLVFLSAGFALMLPTLAKADISSICGNIAGNLVANCGFETGDLSGWTFVGNANISGVSTSRESYSPNSGVNAFFFGAVGSDETLSQNIATTAGDTYTISYYLAGNGTSPSDFSVQWGGSTIPGSVLNPIPNQGYTLYTFDEAATGPGTSLQFSFRNDPSWGALDDVSVVQVGTVAPEPGYLVLVSAGVAGLVWFKRRRPVA
jgi:hypothetical protein